MNTWCFKFLKQLNLVPRKTKKLRTMRPSLKSCGTHLPATRARWTWAAASWWWPTLTWRRWGARWTRWRWEPTTDDRDGRTPGRRAAGRSLEGRRRPTAGWRSGGCRSTNALKIYYSFWLRSLFYFLFRSTSLTSRKQGPRLTYLQLVPNFSCC